MGKIAFHKYLVGNPSDVLSRTTILTWITDCFNFESGAHSNHLRTRRFIPWTNWFDSTKKMQNRTSTKYLLTPFDLRLGTIALLMDSYGKIPPKRIRNMQPLLTWHGRYTTVLSSMLVWLIKTADFMVCHIHMVLGPAESAKPQCAAAADRAIFHPVTWLADADTRAGYPIATLPFGYLNDLNRRPHGLAATAADH